MAAASAEVVSKSAAGRRLQAGSSSAAQTVLQRALDARAGLAADVSVAELRTACAFVDSLAASV